MRVGSTLSAASAAGALALCLLLQPLNCSSSSSTPEPADSGGISSTLEAEEEFVPTPALVWTEKLGYNLLSKAQLVRLLQEKDKQHRRLLRLTRASLLGGYVLAFMALMLLTHEQAQDNVWRAAKLLHPFESVRDAARNREYSKVLESQLNEANRAKMQAAAREEDLKRRYMYELDALNEKLRIVKVEAKNTIEKLNAAMDQVITDYKKLSAEASESAAAAAQAAASKKEQRGMLKRKKRN